MTATSRRRFLESIGAAALAMSGPLGCARDDRVTPFWHSFGGRPRELLALAVKEFHAEQSEHRIQLVYQGDYFETLAKLRTATHVGLAPGLTHIVGESIPYMAEAGALERLSDLPELADTSDLLPALTQEGMFTNPKLEGTFALPFNRSTPVAYCNLAAFAAAGVSPPTTWDELREVARALTQGEGAAKRFGYACAIDWWFWAALVGQAGGTIFDADGEPTMGGDAGILALQLWRDLMDEDVMRPPPGRDYNAWQVVNGDFIEQRASMIWTSTAYVRHFDKNCKFPFATAPLPRLERFSVPTGGTFFIIPKRATDKQKRAAAAFLAFLIRPEQANRFATETGYIPISIAGRDKLTADGYYKAHPSDKVANDQLVHASQWPWRRNLLRVQREIVQPQLESAILERRDLAAVLAEARDAAKDPT